MRTLEEANMKIKLTVLASGQVKYFDSLSECEAWWLIRYGGMSVRIEEVPA
jgi:hypothetical protein